ncbi:hypothetical protein E3N86_15330 [Cryobacterium sp. Hz7]|uniref:hypothetical protein n=1 Tax=Cryobacterium sp. Hz7 TaxID=1259166 RepID=UPI00106CC2D6|nr:hypothetical protein [Cryobacterium sp. Hz7]TFB57920.1 hypothetical protein E3N86_15330 [Cryobacterium sp. Hz7]
MLPVVHNLLIRHAFHSGLIVAIGDEFGRPLWIDGDRTVRSKAEGMLFVEGSDWSERRVGTSAPGTALALDHGIQIQRAEYFNQLAHPWSCTAVRIPDPHSGSILGVIDITGGDEAVAPQTLPLVEAAVAALEAELRIQRPALAAAHRPNQRGRQPACRDGAAARGARADQPPWRHCLAALPARDIRRTGRPARAGIPGARHAPGGVGGLPGARATELDRAGNRPDPRRDLCAAAAGHAQRRVRRTPAGVRPHRRGDLRR